MFHIVTWPDLGKSACSLTSRLAIWASFAPGGNSACAPGCVAGELADHEGPEQFWPTSTLASRIDIGRHVCLTPRPATSKCYLIHSNNFPPRGLTPPMLRPEVLDAHAAERDGGRLNLDVPNPWPARRPERAMAPAMRHRGAHAPLVSAMAAINLATCAEICGHAAAPLPLWLPVAPSRIAFPRTAPLPAHTRHPSDWNLGFGDKAMFCRSRGTSIWEKQIRSRERAQRASWRNSPASR